MTNRSPGDDGAISDIPWASVFDPVVNVRALGEIQARGFRAATALVDQFVRPSAAPKAQSPDTGTSEPPPSAAEGRTAPDADQLLGAWQRLLGQAVQSLRGVGTPGGDAIIDFTKTTASGHIQFETSAPAVVSGEVWLHNTGPDDLGKVRLRCSDLLSHDGAQIASEAVRFDPDPIAMAARCSRGVTVEIDVADDVRPGWYRGTLLADGFAEIWLPVSLHIGSADG